MKKNLPIFAPPVSPFNFVYLFLEALKESLPYTLITIFIIFLEYTLAKRIAPEKKSLWQKLFIGSAIIVTILNYYWRRHTYGQFMAGLVEGLIAFWVSAGIITLFLIFIIFAFFKKRTQA